MTFDALNVLKLYLPSYFYYIFYIAMTKPLFDEQVLDILDWDLSADVLDNSDEEYDYGM